MPAKSTSEIAAPPAGSARPDEKSRVVGQTLGKYHIIKKIGSGGMGTVYLAEHQELKRTVALKVLPLSKAENPTLVHTIKWISSHPFAVQAELLLSNCWNAGAKHGPLIGAT